MSDDRLSGLDNKTDAIDVRPRSQSLKFIRITLVLGILGLVGFLIVWPRLTNVETRPLTRADMNALTQAETVNTLVNPVFNSRDTNNNPFTIIADEAVQDRQNKDMVALKSPTAKFYDGDTREINLKADKGWLDQSSRMLQLENNITLTMDIGMIEGQKLTINQKDETITFYGKTKAVMTSEE